MIFLAVVHPSPLVAFDFLGGHFHHAPLPPIHQNQVTAGGCDYLVQPPWYSVKSMRIWTRGISCTAHSICTGWLIQMVETSRWLRFGMFRHPAWPVGSYSSSSPPAARILGTKSKGGVTLYAKHMIIQNDPHLQFQQLLLNQHRVSPTTMAAAATATSSAAIPLTVPSPSSSSPFLKSNVSAAHSVSFT